MIYFSFISVFIFLVYSFSLHIPIIYVIAPFIVVEALVYIESKVNKRYAD